MHALGAIEFEAVRSKLATFCDTEAGKALARVIEPEFQDESVWFEVGRTAEASALLDKAPVSLAGIKQVETAVERCQKQGSVEGSTLWQIGESLRVMRGSRSQLEPQRAELRTLWLLGQRLANIEWLENKLLTSLDGDGSVHDDASPELKAARQMIATTAKRITAKIQSYVSGKSRELLSDAVFTQRGGRYVVPLKAENRGKIKGIVHDTSASGQTVYIEPEDVVQLGNKLREAEALEKSEVQRVLRDLSEAVGDVGDEILDGLEAAAELDLVLAKARYGHQEGGCVPTRSGEASVRLIGARHPLIDRQEAVPLDLQLGEEFDAILITGPNTGGKTVAIKTVGLAVAMAQCGMMPLADSMWLGSFSQIWADIGDEQSLQQSLSTFSGHIRNISNALMGMRKGALVLLDEIGAGTDPAEGAALARAILLKFQQGGARVLASTHYGELKIFASNAPGFTNAAMEFDQKSLKPTFRLLMGVPGASQAFKIAERHGVPREVIEDALTGVREDELNVSNMIEKLERAQKQAQGAQSEADRLSAQIRRTEAEAEERLAEAKEARARARQDAADELEEALWEIREKAEEVFKSLKPGASQKQIEEARSQLKAIQQTGRETSVEMRPKPEPKRAPEQKLTKGTIVRLVYLDQTGSVIEEPKGGQVNVQIGSMKMSVKLTDVEFVEAPKARSPLRKGASMQLQKGMSAKSEIHLRRLRAEDAIEELERFLDDAVLAGIRTVRVVHGKGEGVLRNITRDVLKSHRSVRSFQDADAEGGGQGVTVAELK